MSLRILIILFIFCLNALDLKADTLRVAIKEAPPFSIKEDDGSWSGLNVDLWDKLCAENGYISQYEQCDMETLTSGLHSGEFDVGLGAITINSERLKKMDFSSAFYASGLGVVIKDREESLFAFVRRFVSIPFLKVVFLLCLVLLGFGFLIWLLERKRNPEQFGGGILNGIGSGFWWSAVTMTTVGYGDKAPVTPAGRVLGFIWMFVALIIISSFTAAITSSLTTSKMEGAVKSPDDLDEVRSAVVSGTISVHYLRKRQVNFTEFKDLESCLSALKKGNVEVVVADYPLLQYQLKSKRDGLRMLPHKFNEFFYGIALRDNFPSKDQLNLSLLRLLESDEWQRIKYHYLGERN